MKLGPQATLEALCIQAFDELGLPDEDGVKNLTNFFLNHYLDLLDFNACIKGTERSVFGLIKDLALQGYDEPLKILWNVFPEIRNPQVLGKFLNLRLAKLKLDQENRERSQKAALSQICAGREKVEQREKLKDALVNFDTLPSTTQNMLAFSFLMALQQVARDTSSQTSERQGLVLKPHKKH